MHITTHIKLRVGSTFQLPRFEKKFSPGYRKSTYTNDTANTKFHNKEGILQYLCNVEKHINK